MLPGWRPWLTACCTVCWVAMGRLPNTTHRHALQQSKSTHWACLFLLAFFGDLDLEWRHCLLPFALLALARLAAATFLLCCISILILVWTPGQNTNMTDLDFLKSNTWTPDVQTRPCNFTAKYIFVHTLYHAGRNVQHHTNLSTIVTNQHNLMLQLGNYEKKKCFQSQQHQLHCLTIL